MSYFIKSDLSAKKVDGVVSGILTLLVEALVFEDLKASVTTRFSEQLVAGLRMRYNGVLWVQQQRV